MNGVRVSNAALKRQVEIKTDGNEWEEQVLLAQLEMALSTTMEGKYSR